MVRSYPHRYDPHHHPCRHSAWSPQEHDWQGCNQSSNVTACLLLLLLLLRFLPINTDESFLPIIMLCQGECRIHGLIRACLASVVAACNTVLSASMILVLSVPFSSKSDSATTNAITASTTIGTSRDVTADDNENNECTGGIHYGLNCFVDDDCVWFFLCVSDKIRSNLWRSWPSAAPLTNILSQLVIWSFSCIYG